MDYGTYDIGGNNADDDQGDVDQFNNQEAYQEPEVSNNDAKTGKGEACRNCGSGSNSKGSRYCNDCGVVMGSSGKAHAGGSGSLGEWTFDPQRYALFGWLETIAGVIMIAMGFANLAAYSNTPQINSTYRIIMGVCCGINLASHAMYIVQRAFYKEIFSFFFQIMCFGAHLCVIIVLFNHSPNPGGFFATFFFMSAMMYGIKFFFIFMQPVGFDLSEHPIIDSDAKLVILNVINCAAALTGFVIQLVISTSSYEE